MSSIPIVINNFNRLSTTKKLVEDLMRLGYENIHILDNGSTYQPLLDWYWGCKEDGTVRIIMLKNMGQLALWNSDYINQFKDCPQYIVYTDSDIELNENTKEGFIEELVRHAISMKSKVGLALEIGDLPNSDLGNRIRKHEEQFWKSRSYISFPDNRPSLVTYDADIDTTFAVIDPKLPFTYGAIRVAGNFTAKHIPWYLDWSNLSEEEKFVLDNLDNKYSTYKGYYLEWLKKQQVNGNN